MVNKNRLKSPKNYRRSNLRCCGTCKHLLGETHYSYPVWCCERDAERDQTEIVGPLEELYDYVCDWYKKGSPIEKL